MQRKESVVLTGDNPTTDVIEVTNNSEDLKNLPWIMLLGDLNMKDVQK